MTRVPYVIRNLFARTASIAGSISWFIRKICRISRIALRVDEFARLLRRYFMMRIPDLIRRLPGQVETFIEFAVASLDRCLPQLALCKDPGHAVLRQRVDKQACSVHRSL